MTEGQERFTLIAIAIPENKEAAVLSEETMERYMEHVLDTITPSLGLLIQADPPSEIRMEILDSLVANGIGGLLHTAMLLNGPPLAKPFLDATLMTQLAQDTKDAAMVRIRMMVADLMGELEVPDV